MITRKIFHQFLRSLRDEVFILQIGGCDGVQADLLTQFRHRPLASGVICEPIPELAEELRGNVPDRFTVAESAVWTHTGRTSIHHVDYSMIPEKFRKIWMKGISTFTPDRNCIGGERWKLKNPAAQAALESAVSPLEVATLTLADLVQQFEIERIDMFVTDMGGSDIVALRQFNFAEFRPKCLVIEHYTHANAEKLEILRILMKNGYLVIRDHQNTFAYLPETFIGA